MDLSIQIINYKSKQYLPGCIDSVIDGLKESEISYQILILNNDASENLSELKIKYPTVEFYESGNNLGFGNGHNFLAAKATGKYLFVLNPDTIIEKNCMPTLYRLMEDHPECGLCGPRVEEPHFFDHKNFWPRKLFIKYCFERFLRIKIFPGTNYAQHNPLIGSAMFFRRSPFDDIGGFDKNLFLYFEEGDICNSLKTKGYVIFFVYDAVLRHFYRRSHASLENNVHFQNSAAYFFKKWPQGDIQK